MMTTTHTAVLVGALLVGSASATAQSRGQPMTGRAVMQTLRAEGHPGGAWRTLQQLDGSVSRAVQDELADSMVAFMIETRMRPRSSIDPVIHVLGGAGVASGGGIPYAGAGARLLRIAYAVESETAAGVLYYVSQLPDRQEALAGLSAFAGSAHPLAYAAIPMLGDMGPDGVEALRVLWRQGTASNSEAKRRLEGLASHFGWRPVTQMPPPPPPPPPKPFTVQIPPRQVPRDTTPPPTRRPPG